MKDQTSFWYTVLISATITSWLHLAVTSQLLWHRKKYWSEFKKILEYAPKVLAVFQMSKHNKTSSVYTLKVLAITNAQIPSQWRKAMTDPLVLSVLKWKAVAWDTAQFNFFFFFFKKPEVKYRLWTSYSCITFLSSFFHMFKKCFPRDFCPSTRFVQYCVLQ